MFAFLPFPSGANQVLNKRFLASMKFLSKVKHEASPCLPSLYFCKRLVHLLESAYFRDHLGLFLPLGAQTS